MTKIEKNLKTHTNYMNQSQLHLQLNIRIMAELEQVIHNVGNYEKLSSSDLKQSLNELGTILRDPTIRSYESINNLIPSIISITNDYITVDNDITLESFRVLINLTADNELNRNDLANTTTKSLEKFWCNISNTLTGSNNDIIDRIILFLGQFIHNSEKTNDYLYFFHNIKLYPALIKRCDDIVDDEDDDIEDTFDKYSDITELISEISKIVKPEEIWNFINCEHLDFLIDTILKLVNELHNNELPSVVSEVLDYLSGTIYNITIIDDIENITSNSHEKIIHTLEKLSPIDKLENITLINRRLFSSSGNISSMNNYNNDQDVQFNLGVFFDHQNTYSVTAASIALGNCINSQETKTKMIQYIESISSIESFINEFFNIKFGDIIQYQSIHLLNNVINESIASIILSSESIISRLNKMNKAIVDNSKYYKEVSQIYFKFLKKLIRSGYIGNQIESNESLIKNIPSLFETWEYLENCDLLSDTEEVYLLLLQAFITKFPTFESGNIAFYKKLLNYSISDKNSNSKVSIQFLLEKLKTIGITLTYFNTNNINPDYLISKIYNSSTTNFETEFYHPFLHFLQQLNDSIQTSLSSSNDTNENFQFKALLNNSKYVAATTITFSTHCDLSATTRVLEVCKAIMKSPQQVA